MAFAVEKLPEKNLPDTTRALRIPATLALYWHLLSLDAPTVAALWSWSFARSMRVALPLAAPLLLAAGTWLIYVADRLLDGLGRHDSAQLRARHHFYARHRRFFLLAGVLIGSAFLWIVFTRMPRNVRRDDTVVFVVAALYFLLIHARSPSLHRWLPKELAVGALFAAATAVPAWARIPGQRWILFPAVALFAVLCWLNCAAIECWECSKRTSILAHFTSTWAVRHLQALTAGTAALGFILSLARSADTPQTCLYLAIAASALLLLWLGHSENRLSATQLRIAADAALLTPLLFLAWMR